MKLGGGKRQPTKLILILFYFTALLVLIVWNLFPNFLHPKPTQNLQGFQTMEMCFNWSLNTILQYYSRQTYDVESDCASIKQATHTIHQWHVRCKHKIVNHSLHRSFYLNNVIDV